MKNAKCEDCKYWEKVEETEVFVEGDLGRCKRYAPPPIYKPFMPKPSGVDWALTKTTEWCGEFKNGKKKKAIKKWQ